MSMGAGAATPRPRDAGSTVAPAAEAPTRYGAIVVDPPWPYPDGFNGWGKRRALPYPSMTIYEINCLPVISMIEREGYVFMWTTNRYLHEAFHALDLWGFTYKQTLVWCKAPMGSGLGGMFASTAEYILVGQAIAKGTNAHSRRTKPGRVATSWFEWKRPYNGDGKPMHSAKPEALQDLVESVCPGPYLEMFARRQRLGWHVWGDEVDSHVDVMAGHKTRHQHAVGVPASEDEA